MKVQLAYESSFLRHFGRNMSKHLTSIKTAAKMFYQHPSLDTKVNIEFGNDIDAGTVEEIEKRGPDGKIIAWDVGLE